VQRQTATNVAGFSSQADASAIRSVFEAAFYN
jgi:hypothetical protein